MNRFFQTLVLLSPYTGQTWKLLIKYFTVLINVISGDYFFLLSTNTCFHYCSFLIPMKMFRSTRQTRKALHFELLMFITSPLRFVECSINETETLLTSLLTYASKYASRHRTANNSPMKVKITIYLAYTCKGNIRVVRHQTTRRGKVIPSSCREPNPTQINDAKQRVLNRVKIFNHLKKKNVYTNRRKKG